MNPGEITLFLQEEEKGKREEIPKIRSNDTTLLNAVGSEGGTSAGADTVNVLGVMMELLYDGDDVARHASLLHGLVDSGSIYPIESFGKIQGEADTSRACSFDFASLLLKSCNPGVVKEIS